MFFSVFFLGPAPSSEKKENPNFLLVTIDTWRADYISASGSGKVATPFLDSLAKEGAYLKAVDTTVPFTTPAHASIMTGLYPIHHGIRDNSHFRLGTGVMTMARMFRENGYHTIGVVSCAPLKKNYGLDAGFDIYDEEGLGREGVEIGDLATSRIGEKSAARAIELARKSPPGALFLWLHLYDPHYPYAAPGNFLNRYPGDRYAGEVAYIDDVLRRFSADLMRERKGRWIILVTGDHGEGLGDKGEETHGLLLYRQTREVPLILWDSARKEGSFGAGTKSLIDIFPTVAELFSFKAAPTDGTSLFKDTQESRWLFSESYYPTLSFGVNPSLLARKGGKIYIRHGTSSEIYLKEDEDRDMSKTEIDFAAKAESRLTDFFLARSIPPPNLTLSDEEAGELMSLGYISSPGMPLKILQCDLRTFSRDFSAYFSKGQEDIRRGDLETALGRYRMMLLKYPGSPLFHFETAGLLIQMKRFKEAKSELIACLKLDPGHSDALLNMGTMMRMEGRPREAEKFYLSSMKCEEDRALLHLDLGALYARDLKKNDLAVRHFKRFLELDPGYAQRSEVEAMIKTLSKEN